MLTDFWVMKLRVTLGFLFVLFFIFQKPDKSPLYHQESKTTKTKSMPWTSTASDDQSLTGARPRAHSRGHDTTEQAFEF